MYSAIIRFRTQIRSRCCQFVQLSTSPANDKVARISTCQRRRLKIRTKYSVPFRPTFPRYQVVIVTFERGSARSVFSPLSVIRYRGYFKRSRYNRELFERAFPARVYTRVYIYTYENFVICFRVNQSCITLSRLPGKFDQSAL